MNKLLMIFAFLLSTTAFAQNEGLIPLIHSADGQTSREPQLTLGQMKKKLKEDKLDLDNTTNELATEDRDLKRIQLGQHIHSLDQEINDLKEAIRSQEAGEAQNRKASNSQDKTVVASQPLPATPSDVSPVVGTTIYPMEQRK